MLSRPFLIVLATATILTVGALGSAQEKQAAEQPAQAPFRLDKPVESWYKIIAGGKHIGFMHTRVQPDGDGYSYIVEMDAPLKVGEKLQPIAFSGSATLDRRFIPNTMQSGLTSENRTITFSMTTGSGIKKIMGEEVGEKKRSTQKYHRGAEEEIFCDLQNGLFAMRAKGDMGKPGERRALEIAIPNPAEASVKAAVVVKEAVSREYLGKTVRGVECGFDEPFAIVPGFPVASLIVDAYGRILEVVSAGEDLMTITIVENSIKARPHEGTIPIPQHRSPFDKRAAMSGKTESPAAPSEGSKKTGDEPPVPTDKDAGQVEALMDRLVKIVGEMEANIGQEEKLKHLSGKFVAARSELLKQVGSKSPAILQRIQELTDRAKKIHDPTLAIRDKAKQARESMAAIYRTEPNAKLQPLMKLIRECVDDPSLLGAPNVLQEVRKFLTDAEEFDRINRKIEILKAKKPAINGILYHLRDEAIPLKFNVSLLGYEFDYAQSIYFPVPDSYAIVNGKTVREGDVVEGFQVKRILEGGVVLGDSEVEVMFDFKMDVKR